MFDLDQTNTQRPFGQPENFRQSPDQAAMGAEPPGDPLDLELTEFEQFMREAEEQPAWRTKADKEMDYVAGNQLDSELLRRQRQLGIPPAVENIIGPQVQAICGMEEKTRKDWRVRPNGETDGDDVAAALNFKLNEAERLSGADAACSAAFRPQFCVGLGWVEVSRESNPFKYKYRCDAIHRNEIHWDFKAKRADLSDARWLVRKRWMHKRQVALAFPNSQDLIHHATRWAENYEFSMDGGASTGLHDSWAMQRGSSIQEQMWVESSSNQVCLFEVWYRRWVRVVVLNLPGGRVVEFDEANPAHTYAAATGVAKITSAIVSRVRRAYYVGPHKLHDGPSPYAHDYFPYVPFWGWREDVTNVPYGAVRAMIYPQDALNSGISKLRWGMSSVRTERTKGAVDMTDAQFRQQVARVDADIVLNAEAMARPGARFEVKRDFQLNDQQYRMLDDSRNSVYRTSGITPAMMGSAGTATSNAQEQTQLEQAIQTNAEMMGSFGASRMLVGELLLSMIIQDQGATMEQILVPGEGVVPDRMITINEPLVDEATGVQYLNNDIQRIRLKVVLDDVASTPSFRAQQLSALSEAVKSLPPQYQAAVLPFMVALMDIPNRIAVIDAIRQAGAQATPEQIQKQIDQAVQDALAKSGHDLKARELDLKQEKQAAEIANLTATRVLTGVQAAFSAMQAGAQVAQMPQIAPIADVVMQGAGYRPPTPAGVDPNFPQPGQIPAQASAEAAAAPPVHRNTSPEFPPVPQHAASPATGIETATPADNLNGVTHERT